MNYSHIFITSYRENDNEYRIGDNSNSTCNGVNSQDIPEILTIPSVIDGKNIVEIGRYAFRSCSVIKFINIEEGIQTIGGYAFHETNITHAFLPSSLEKISNNAFDDCFSLETVQINQPSQLVEIAVAAFSTCKKLKSFIIPPTLQRIGNNTFTEIETNFTVYYCGTNIFPPKKIFGTTKSFQIIVPRNGVGKFAGYETTQGTTPCDVKSIGSCVMRCTSTYVAHYFLCAIFLH